jgi:hypothetical protein
LPGKLAGRAQAGPQRSSHRDSRRLTKFGVDERDPP